MKNASRCGLQAAYRQSEDIRFVIRKFMSLPLLPPNHIIDNFETILRAMPLNENLSKLARYMHHQWIESSVHSIQSISVFNQSIRTNNDCECYHNRLRCISRDHLNLYKLIDLLYEESAIVKVTVNLVSIDKDNRN